MNFLATLATTLLVVVQSIGDVKQHFPQPPDSEGQLEQSGSYTLAVEKSGKFLRQENPNVDQQSSDSSLSEAPKMATKKFKPLKRLQHLPRHIGKNIVSATQEKKQLKKSPWWRIRKKTVGIVDNPNDKSGQCKDFHRRSPDIERLGKILDIFTDSIRYTSSNTDDQVDCLAQQGIFRVSSSEKNVESAVMQLKQLASLSLKLGRVAKISSTRDECLSLAVAVGRIFQKYNILPKASSECWKRMPKLLENIPVNPKVALKFSVEGRISEMKSNGQFDVWKKNAKEYEEWLNQFPWYAMIFKKLGRIFHDISRSETTEMPVTNLAIAPGPKMFPELPATLESIKELKHQQVIFVNLFGIWLAAEEGFLRDEEDQMGN